MAWEGGLSMSGKTRGEVFFSKAKYIILIFMISSIPTSVLADTKDDFEPWTVFQQGIAQQILFSNINTPDSAAGTILASPSTYPFYRYFWIRDGALIINYLLDLYENTSSAETKNKVEKVIFSYIDLSRKQQLTINPAGGPSDTGLGEVKFNEDGSIYTFGWPRPQNDGPALRAGVLIRFAYILLKSGREEYVRTKLYDGKYPNTETVIKADLEYTAHHWRDPSYDLWEEVKGDHFYTRMAQRKALMDGAKFADRIGDDPKTSKFYSEQVSQLKIELSKHWDSGRGYLVATLNQIEGHQDKKDNLDISIILALLHSPQEDGFMSFTDDMILATVSKLYLKFSDAYEINKNYRLDSAGKEMGPAQGRYFDDRFNGYNNNTRGNPWILATAGMAEFAYRARNEWQKVGHIKVTELNLPYLKIMMPELGAVVGETILSRDVRFRKAMLELKDSGDKFLRRIKFHSRPDGSLSEQWDRETGFMTSAENLTWSCSSVMTATQVR